MRRPANRGAVGGQRDSNDSRQNGMDRNDAKNVSIGPARTELGQADA